MIVLDSYAVLAFLNDEAAAVEVQRLLESDERPMLSPIGLAEVLDHLVRVVGIHPEEATLDVAQLGLAQTAPLDASSGMRAGLLRAHHYHRKLRAVSLADCVAADTAQVLGGRLATSDPHLLDLCAAEGIAVIALPDTTGRIWRTPEC